MISPRGLICLKVGEVQDQGFLKEFLELNNPSPCNTIFARSRVLDSRRINAYGITVVHYRSEF